MELDQACDAVDIARREVDNCWAEISFYQDKVSKFQTLISNAEDKVQDADRKLDQMWANLCALSRRRGLVADVQNKVRRAVNQLGLLCGVATVAELQTRRLVLLRPVMTMMEEMTPALARITGEGLLNTEGIRSLMGCMKKNQEKLNQLARARQSADDEYY